MTGSLEQSGTIALIKLTTMLMLPVYAMGGFVTLIAAGCAFWLLVQHEFWICVCVVASIYGLFHFGIIEVG
jgi:hypothetical protein